MYYDDLIQFIFVASQLGIFLMPKRLFMDAIGEIFIT